MSVINIYSVPQVAHLTVEGVNARKHMITHAAYGRTTFKLFRNVDNELDFLIRDIDRQPVTIDGNLVFHVWDDNGQDKLTISLAPANPQRGHYKLHVTAEQTLAIRSGIYVWSVTSVKDDVTKLLYTNQDYGSKGIIEVAEGANVPAHEPTLFTLDDMLLIDGYYHTSPVAARSSSLGAHTAVVSTTNFTGVVRVRVSMDDQPPVDDMQWGTLVEVSLTDKTGDTIVFFEGNYKFIKFLITSAEGIKRLIYRN